jgi:hypothetical protein
LMSLSVRCGRHSAILAHLFNEKSCKEE